MSAHLRERLATVLAVVSLFVLALAIVVGYAERAAGNADQFANRATTALTDPSVRDLLGQRITDEIVLQRKSDLLAARPLIQSAVSSMLGSRAFAGLFAAGVRDVHRAVLEGSQNTVTLTLHDVDTVVRAALDQFRPDLARRIDSGKVVLLRRDLNTLVAEGAHLTAAVRTTWIVLVLLYVALLLAGLWLAPDRRRSAIHFSAAIAGAGLLVLVGLRVAGDVATGGLSGADATAAGRAVWDAFFGGLHTLAWLVAALGAILAASSASVIRPPALDEPLRRFVELIRHEPRRPVWRALRGATAAALGLAIALNPDTAVRALVTITGIYLVYGGATALLALIYSPEEAAERAAARAAAPRHSQRRRLMVPLFVAAAAIALTTAGAASTGVLTVPGKSRGGCNGHVELCERPLNEVAFAATHNSMSVPLPGWFSAEQERPIPSQLADGIHALLIDTYFADLLPNGRHRTVFGKNPLEANGADSLGPEATAAALRIRDRLGFKGQGERGMFLCHGFCELGATPVAEVLRQIRDFLVANPDEVLLIINQDDVPPAAFVAEVRKAGLEPFAYDGPVTGRWPTLREMIDSGKRLVIFSEHQGGAAPWYRVGYDAALQETPFAFAKVAELTDPKRWPASCVPHRGKDTAPLLLLNHWITNDPVPLPSVAAQVNAYEPLLGRARACQKQRHRLPNIVAVNFYRRGDLMKVVDSLNGVT